MTPRPQHRFSPMISSFIRIHSCLLLWLSLSTIAYAQELNRYEFSQVQMGTTFRLVFYTQNDSTAQLAARASFQKIEQLNQILSDYLPESELNRLSAAAGNGQWVTLSKDLWNVLFQAQQFARQSNGGFDVTAGLIIRLWRRARRKQEWPDSSRLAQALKKTGFKYLKLKRKSQQAKLKLKGMRLDLGGIAKGYAVDQALYSLQSYGIEHALVDGGGDMRASKAPPGQKAWKIALEGKANEIILLTHRAVATSGDLYQFLAIDGVRYSHIVNPHTGLGLTHQCQVTVIAPSCMKADALASAISVTGAQKAKGLLKKKSETYFQINCPLSKDTGVYQSPGFEHYLNNNPSILK